MSALLALRSCSRRKCLARSLWPLQSLLKNECRLLENMYNCKASSSHLLQN